MKKFLLLAVFFGLTASMFSKSIAGKEFPDNLKIGKYNLVFNGGGVIKKFLFKVYAIGLFTESKTSDANAILNNKPYAIRIHFIHNGVTDDKIKEAWKEGFHKSTGGNVAPLQKEFETFMSYFKGTYNENDTYQFEYVPGEGTKIIINWKVQGVIPGAGFAKALAGIWIGSDPRDNDVKNDMLGK
jgi:hypothetical protein